MIVGIAGKKRAGKDVIANFLVNEYAFLLYKFATPMKKIVHIMYDWDERHTEGDLKEVVDLKWGISPRQALQVLGTDWAQYDLCSKFPLFGEITGKDLWVNLFKSWYKKHSEFNVVISDVRFPHEVEILKEMGAVLFKTTRPGLSLTDTHESESYIDGLNVDYNLNNNSTVENLKKLVDNILKIDGYIL